MLLEGYLGVLLEHRVVRADAEVRVTLRRSGVVVRRADDFVRVEVADADLRLPSPAFGARTPRAAGAHSGVHEDRAGVG